MAAAQLPEVSRSRRSLPVLGQSSRGAGDDVPSFADIDAQLQTYAQEQKARLGIVDEIVEHWFDANPQTFRKRDRGSTTLLCGGLTRAQDYFVSAALQSVGYQVECLDVPDTEALRFGKEFGNRGQCNPTYFTVGNLVKHLVALRDGAGLTSAQIVQRYVFLTAGACGPCRFGTYATEYRKALRDAGFDGFRVLLFQQQNGIKQATGDEQGLDLSPKFFFAILKAIMAGDVLNAIGYRIRPYELNPGDTNAALERCKQIIHDALAHKRSILRALRQSRRILRAVKVDRLQAKPKVSIIGEFWAMTTEGDGNYKLQQFLEAEGAEVDIQLVSAWILYNIWQVRYDTKRRMNLRRDDGGRQGLAGKAPWKRLLSLAVAEKVLKGAFHTFAWAVGLRHYKLPDMGEIATISHQYYDNDLRGGEGHMEVGKLIQSAKKKKAHMVISVKPFGCMPSSGVSDGVQSLITNKYPETIFTAIETTGDGEVNVQSRVQMDLFKARLGAAREFDEICASVPGRRVKRLRRRLGALSYPAHRPGVAGTAATLVQSKRAEARRARFARDNTPRQ